MIKRNLLDKLKDHLPKKEISLIVGPRQAGKTTLMLLLKEYLEKRGEKTLFLNLDIESDNRFFSSQDLLVRKIQLELGREGGYVFIDEIQRKENAGLFLKGLYDMRLPYKFIVSGSGSLDLKEKIHESLVGRKRLFDLNPVSFQEFVNYKTGEKYYGNLQEFFDIEKEKVQHLLSEYMNFGGYPRVVLEETIEEKRRTIDEIYRSYIEKDIAYFLKVEKLDAYGMLIKILAGQVGQMINYSELANTIGLSVATVKNYLHYGEATFIVRRVTPYFTNLRKEITKSPIAYFYDLGLRNYSLGMFSQLYNPNDLGYVFENFVFNLLKEKFKFTGCSLHYWRTKDKSEVDIVIRCGSNLVPLEVKYKRFHKVQIERSLRSFITRYNPKAAFVVTLDFEDSLQLERTTVFFIPFWRLYSLDFTSEVPGDPSRKRETTLDVKACKSESI
ncbi:MAG: ATP-binding protein [Candidatus Aminicenantes bacterium]|nr:MAG: ATP-binding protein [Candidatus Aminicenantes bacterium]